ncbi:MAG: CDP-glucose 4,6-dehydratase [bacterium]
MNTSVFNNVFGDKKVLITGNTGFKGSWLTSWLLELGAKVYGISNEVPTKPSMFEVLKLEKKIDHAYIDIRDGKQLKEKITSIAPDFIFHLAAQPIVSLSYKDPLDTISTNVMGTANTLEAIRELKNDCVAIIITSDKCYENIEQIWGYKEDDQVGGKDIYSGSKGAAEVIFHSYYYSFFKNKHPNIRLATARAGNVIGGGDWAPDRIVVDCMKAWSNGEKVTIRSPQATRPWQHVLEPLSGYLRLAQVMFENFESKKFNGDSFNFGPKSEQNKTVLSLLTDLSNHWHFSNADDAFEVTDNIPFHEAGLLKLNCEKAATYLKWQPTLNFEETIKFVSKWYYNFYNKKDMSIYEYTISQLNEYVEKYWENDR